MSPMYLNPQASSPIPFLELKGDLDQQHTFQIFGHVHDHDLATSSNSFSNSYHSYNSQEMLSFDYSRHGHAKVENLVLSHEKASDLGQPCSSWLQSTVEDDSGYGFPYNLQGDQKIETANYDEDHTDKTSRKCKPSKVRIMQKMMATTSKNSGNNDKQQLDHHDLAKQHRQNNDGIRVCSDCHTTTTPLWRSGPQGPKSLCNACGIRQRKARRAAMAAAAATEFGNDSIVTSTTPPVEGRKPTNKVQEIKAEKGIILEHDKSHTLPLKKRSKIIDAGIKNNNYYIDDNTLNNTHNNARKIGFEDYLKPNSQRSFPRDEEEGAILLMALSCGLACSSL